MTRAGKLILAVFAVTAVAMWSPVVLGGLTASDVFPATMILILASALVTGLSMSTHRAEAFSDAVAKALRNLSRGD